VQRAARTRLLRCAPRAACVTRALGLTRSAPQGARVEASAAFTAALAAALADSAAADSFGLAPETADAPRLGRLRRGPASHSISEPAASQPAPTKLRLRWTPELAAAFETAVAALGGLQYAAPQQILSRMRDAGDAPSELNLAHLKSHLQKSRLADVRRRAAAAAAAAAAGVAPPEEAVAGGAGGIALLLRLAAATHRPARAAAAPDQTMPPAKAARRR
jgi:SHAQKYF class myb-like DNA-binding protein